MKTTHTEIFLFDTCTHKCSYCHYAESAKVLDNSQLNPYLHMDFIDKISNFFIKRTNLENNFILYLTGGEPLIMPNFEIFAQNVGSVGNKIAINTALLVNKNCKQFKFLLTEDSLKIIDYLMISFHPETEKYMNQFIERLKLLKKVGHNLILRFVGHPDRFFLLPELDELCRNLDICFYPTPIFTNEYPKKYSLTQKQELSKYFTSISQHILLNNGLLTSNLKCNAGSKLISIDMRSGVITPCITTKQPILGNLYDDIYNPLDIKYCSEPGIGCTCDIHFQQNIIPGAYDQHNFNKIKLGYVNPKDFKVTFPLKLIFSTAKPLIGQTDMPIKFQAIPKEIIKEKYKDNKNYFENSYRKNNHKFFKKRQSNNNSLISKIQTIFSKFF